LGIKRFPVLPTKFKRSCLSCPISSQLVAPGLQDKLFATTHCLPLTPSNSCSHPMVSLAPSLQLATLVDTSGCMETHEAMRALGYPCMPSWAQAFEEHESRDGSGLSDTEDGGEGDTATLVHASSSDFGGVCVCDVCCVCMYVWRQCVPREEGVLQRTHSAGNWQPCKVILESQN